jgi:hypothetical protein
MGWGCVCEARFGVWVWGGRGVEEVWLQILQLIFECILNTSNRPISKHIQPLVSSNPLPSQQAIESLQLDIDGYTVKWSILSHARIKLKEAHVRAVAKDMVGWENVVGEGGVVTLHSFVVCSH